MAKTRAENESSMMVFDQLKTENKRDNLVRSGSWDSTKRDILNGDNIS
jgi:hypothetical protein